MWVGGGIGGYVVRWWWCMWLDGGGIGTVVLVSCRWVVVATGECGDSRQVIHVRCCHRQSSVIRG